MSIALATALPHAPTRVLRLVGPKYPLEEVCGIPFLRADSTDVITYHDEAKAALVTVRDSSLRNVRLGCSTTLDDARQRRLERIDPAYIIKNKPTPVRSRRR